MANICHGRRKGCKDKKKKTPAVDMSKCSNCESCLELCPAVFRRNKEAGWIEVIELDEYPEKEIQEVIICCPRGCISWEEEA